MCEHPCTNACVNLCFSSPWVHLKVELLGHSARELLTCFPECLQHFRLSPGNARGLVSPDLHPHLFSLIIIITMGMKWHITIVLICISQMTNDVEHLFMCSLAVYIVFFGNMSFQIHCPFFSWGGLSLLSVEL